VIVYFNSFLTDLSERCISAGNTYGENVPDNWKEEYIRVTRHRWDVVQCSVNIKLEKNCQIARGVTMTWGSVKCLKKMEAGMHLVMARVALGEGINNLGFGLVGTDFPNEGDISVRGCGYFKNTLHYGNGQSYSTGVPAIENGDYISFIYNTDKKWIMWFHGANIIDTKIDVGHSDWAIAASLYNASIELMCIRKVTECKIPKEVLKIQEKRGSYVHKGITS